MKQLKYFVISIATFTFLGVGQVQSSFIDFEKEFTQYPEKLHEWNVMANEVDQIVDALGKPIDTKIKDAVIVLNLLGFKTSQSCEGHLDWGLPYPWIDFDIYDDEYYNLMHEIQNIREQFQGDILLKKARELHTLLDKKIYAKLAPIYLLLERFYNDKRVSYDCVVNFEDRSSRIQSLGGPWQSILTYEQKKEKLEGYQNEMNEFTNFLIAEFLRK